MTENYLRVSSAACVFMCRIPSPRPEIVPILIRSDKNTHDALFNGMEMLGIWNRDVLRFPRFYYLFYGSEIVMISGQQFSVEICINFGIK